MRELLKHLLSFFIHLLNTEKKPENWEKKWLNAEQHLLGDHSNCEHPGMNYFGSKKLGRPKKNKEREKYWEFEAGKKDPILQEELHKFVKFTIPFWQVQVYIQPKRMNLWIEIFHLICRKMQHFRQAMRRAPMLPSVLKIIRISKLILFKNITKTKFHLLSLIIWEKQKIIAQQTLQKQSEMGSHFWKTNAYTIS